MLHLTLIGPPGECEAALQTLELAWNVRNVILGPSDEASHVRLTAQATPGLGLVLCVCGHAASGHTEDGCRDCGCVVAAATWHTDDPDDNPDEGRIVDGGSP